MGEIKSVKVDNWGVFFLQKLQNFFNKTDYCDLTLQFDDNSQLKVHRLVLSACTDYFNVLEHTCDVNDDILTMPRELQADVVVPIVNFMYTGTLEFEINMYARLLKTAKDMNMTVLLKLLEAHRRTVEGTRAQILNRTQKIKRPTSQVRPQQYEPRSYSTQSNTSNQRQSHQPLPNIIQYKSLQIKPLTPSTSFYSKSISEPVAMITKYGHSKAQAKGPSRFDCVDETFLPPDSFEQSFDNISYESKPLITATQICKEECDMDDYDNVVRKHETAISTYSSQFEQLKRSYTGNNKRPASSTSSFESPPEKKPNIQDVKEYAEQQRMRKQIAAEFDDDNEYDEVLDDEFHNDDDDDDYIPPPSYQKQFTKQYQTQKPIVIKQEKNQKPTIVVKDSAGSSVNHAKIISEVLKKYPHLVKNNKNIKLKIMPKSNTSPTQKVVIKQESMVTEEQVVRTPKPNILQEVVKRTILPETGKPPLPSILSKPAVATTSVTKPAANSQTRRIDSKTMHALIALGAENVTGPWLCLRCGVDGRPISIPSYRGFRRHLIHTHKEKIDPRLCEHCGWRSKKNRELFHHLLVQHSIKAPYAYVFPKCDHCELILIDDNDLEKHVNEIHPEKMSQHCIYCNMTFSKEIVLYAHMRTKHKNRAREDGVMDFSDEETGFEDNDSEQAIQSGSDGIEKIKILSNISLPKNAIPISQSSNDEVEENIGLESNSQTEVLGNVATGIATSLGLIDSTNTTTVVGEEQVLSEQYIDEDGEDFDKKVPKFVNADGNVMDLTPAQQQEIISQLDQQHGDVVMVLNQETFAATVAGETESATTPPVTGHEIVGNDPNMFIVYSESNESEAKKSSEKKVKSPTSVADKIASELGEDWHENESQTSADETIKEDKLEEALKAMEGDTDKELDTSIETTGSDDKKESLLQTLSETCANEEKLESTSKTSTPKASEKINAEEKINKLKLLSGDWSEDEEEDDEEEEIEVDTKKTSKNPDDPIEEKNKLEKDVPISPAPDKEEVLFETLTATIETEKPAQSDKENEKLEKESEKTKSKENEKNGVKDDHSEKTASETIDKEIEAEITSDEKETDKETEVKDEAKEESEEEIKNEEKDNEKTGDDINKDETESLDNSKKDESLITKDEIRNLISDWGDEDDDDDI